MKRVFLGVDLSENLKNKIEEFKLKQQLNKLPIKLVEPTNSHIAIKFLDDLTDEQIGQIDQIIKKIQFNFLDLTIKANGLLFFPNLQFAKVMALKVDSPKLTEFGNTLIKQLEQLPFVIKENRRYTPHITLGRIKSPLSESDQKKLIGLTFSDQFIIKSFKFFESKLTNAGPIYSIISNYNL
jgi:2'-5' RNA ligase